jgi:toxin ParE1/3/4
MSRRVNFREIAEADVDEQCLFLARRSARLALRFYEAIQSTALRLAESPDLGTRLDSMMELETNILVWKVDGFSNHLLLFLATPDGIDVVRILHASRDIAALFESGDIL